MIKIVFEENVPVGEVLINLLDEKICCWEKYKCNWTFSTLDSFNNRINQIEMDQENKDKVLVIVNDSSKHPYTMRSSIRIYSKDYLKLKQIR